MKASKLLIALVALTMLVVSCSKDEFVTPTIDKPKAESENVVKMISDRGDAIINLAIDAPAHSRNGVWIDLDGNGKRAEDGSEDVTIFNRYVEYAVSLNVGSIDVYGDITYLGAANNELMAIDVSKSEYLMTLNVPVNNLKEIDVTSNHALQRLDCSENKIALLDVAQNRELVTLWSFNNELISLDVSNNSYLSFLDCSGNKLSALNVSNNVNLMRLLCYNNQITSLNIDLNNSLNRLWMYGNPLSENEIEEIADKLGEVIKGDAWLSISTKESVKETLQNKGWRVFD